MLNELLTRYPVLEGAKDQIVEARDAIIECYKNGGKLLLCGNGGSCADCDHIVGELMKGFLKLRPLSEEKKNEMKANCSLVDDEILNKLQDALPAVSLPSISFADITRRSRRPTIPSKELKRSRPLLLLPIATNGFSKIIEKQLPWKESVITISALENK